MYSYIRHTLCESLPLYPGRIGLVRPTMLFFFNNISYSFFLLLYNIAFSLFITRLHSE